MTDAADDFDALFEEVAAQRATAAAPVAPAPVPEPAAAAGDNTDDLEALFDQVATASAPAPAPAPAASVAAAPAANHEPGDEKGMYERLGGIVRVMHDSLRELGYDKALTEASSQIVD